MVAVGQRIDGAGKDLGRLCVLAQHLQAVRPVHLHVLLVQPHAPGSRVARDTIEGVAYLVDRALTVGRLATKCVPIRLVGPSDRSQSAARPCHALRGFGQVNDVDQVPHFPGELCLAGQHV